MKKDIRKKMLNLRNSLTFEHVTMCQDRIFARLCTNVTTLQDLECGSSSTQPLNTSTAVELPFLLPDAKYVMCYSDFKNEVKTEKIKFYCLSHGITYCLPVTRPKNFSGKASGKLTTGELTSGKLATADLATADVLFGRMSSGTSTSAKPAPSFMDAYVIEESSALVPDKFGVLIPDTRSCVKANPKLIDLILVPGVAFDFAGNRLGFGKGYYDTFLPQTPNAVKIALAYDFQVVEDLPAEPWDVPMDFIITENGTIDCSKYR